MGYTPTIYPAGGRLVKYQTHDVPGRYESAEQAFNVAAAAAWAYDGAFSVFVMGETLITSRDGSSSLGWHSCGDLSVEDVTSRRFTRRAS
jgi:hypothetical protein